MISRRLFAAATRTAGVAALAVAVASAAAFRALRPGSPLADFLDYGGSK